MHTLSKLCNILMVKRACFFSREERDCIGIYGLVRDSSASMISNKPSGECSSHAQGLDTFRYHSSILLVLLTSQSVQSTITLCNGETTSLFWASRKNNICKRECYNGYKSKKIENKCNFFSWERLHRALLQCKETTDICFVVTFLLIIHTPWRFMFETCSRVVLFISIFSHMKKKSSLSLPTSVLYSSVLSEPPRYRHV